MFACGRLRAVTGRSKKTRRPSDTKQLEEKQREREKKIREMEKEKHDLVKELQNFRIVVDHRDCQHARQWRLGTGFAVVHGISVKECL